MFVLTVSAAAWNHLPIVQLLLHRGCQFAVRNFEGFTASDFAYSKALQSSLQSIARDVFEERRTRRKEAPSSGSDDERDDDNDML